jgi:epsilon-lactone hydrolase
VSKEQLKAVDSLLRRSNFAGGSTVQELRSNFARAMSSFPVPDGVVLADTRLGDRPALRISPAAGTGRGTILYFHGGSYIFGSPRTNAPLTAQLVLRTGLAALSVDYRLAPEHPFPAAIQDTVSAYRALLEAGTGPETIVFAGDSAGGGLTVTTMLRARELGLPMPACVVAFSPGLDATHTGESMRTREGADPFFTQERLEQTGVLYTAGQDVSHPLLSPAVSADLTGLAPMLLQVGTSEILLDDSVRMAVRAAHADVEVVLDVVPGAPHVFQGFAGTGTLDEADLALDRAGLFVRQHVRGADQVPQ